MTEEIIIHIDPETHPALYKALNQLKTDLKCTWPQVIEALVDRGSLRRRIAKDMKETLIDLGVIERDKDELDLGPR